MNTATILFLVILRETTALDDIKGVDRIVGGDYVAIKNNPHVAFYEVVCKDDLYDCGASILNQHILLTAGHCLESCPPKSEITISVGNNHKDKGYKYSGERFQVHEKYKSETLENDIALIKTSKAMRLGDSVKRVLLTQFNKKADKNSFVAGWGVINEETEETTAYLKGAPQKLLSSKECQMYLSEEIPPGSICTIAYGGGNSYGYAARGDSGGPLVTDKHVQIGIVSFKEDAQESVVVFTDVRQHYKWIQKTTKMLYCL